MKNTRGVVIGVAAIIVTAIFFVVPFLFVFVIASKDRVEANLLEFSWPTNFVLFHNIAEALASRDYLMVIAFINSFILTVTSVAALVILSAMVAYVWQRRRGRWSPLINGLVLAGLIVPPAIVPTIWVLQGIGLFKTMPGLILIEIAYGLPFCVLLFRAFIAGVPKELDEAAVVDGAGPVQIFFRVIFPVLRSVMMTVIILQSVAIYNDFAAPAVLPARNRERHHPAHLAQLPKPVHHRVQPAVRDHPAGRDSTADHVHLLQPQDRRGDGRGLGQGLTCADCTDHQNSGGIVWLSQASSLAAMKSERASSPVNGWPDQASITAIRSRAASGEG